MKRPFVGFIAAVIAIQLLTGSVSAQDPSSAGKIRISGFIGYGLLEQEDINKVIELYDEDYIVDEDDWDYITSGSDKITGGVVFGASAEYRVSEKLGIGLEYARVSGEGRFSWEGYDSEMRDYWAVEEEFEFKTSANLLSLFAIYRVPLGESRAALRLGGGLGMALGAQFELTDRWYLDYGYARSAGGRPMEQGTERLRASGSSFALHGLLGIEYGIGERFFLTGDVAYRYASVDELKVDSVTEWMAGDPDDPEVVKGGTLKWSDLVGFSTRAGENIGLDFSGFYLTLGVSVAF